MVVLSVCIEEGPVFSDSLQIWGITYVLGLTVSKVAILTWNILSFHKGMYLLVWLFCFIYLENSIVWCEIFFCSKLTVITFNCNHFSWFSHEISADLVCVRMCHVYYGGMASFHDFSNVTQNNHGIRVQYYMSSLYIFILCIW